MTKKDIVMTMKKALYEARYLHAYFGIKKGWKERVTENYRQQETALSTLLADCKVKFIMSDWFMTAFDHGRNDATAGKDFRLSYIQELAEKEVR